MAGNRQTGKRAQPMGRRTEAAARACQSRTQKLLGWAGPGGAGSKAVQAESSGGRSAGGGSGAPLGDLAVRGEARGRQ